jgi:hypothetical protein
MIERLSDLPNLHAGNAEQCLVGVGAIVFVFSCGLCFWVNGWMLKGRGGKMGLLWWL